MARHRRRGCAPCTAPQMRRMSGTRLWTCYAGRAGNAQTIKGAAPDLNHRMSCRGSSGSASLPAQHVYRQRLRIVSKASLDANSGTGWKPILQCQDFQHAVYLGFGVVEVRTETNVLPAFSVLPGRTHNMLRG